METKTLTDFQICIAVPIIDWLISDGEYLDWLDWIGSFKCC